MHKKMFPCSVHDNLFFYFFPTDGQWAPIVEQFISLWPAKSLAFAVSQSKELSK